MSKKKKDPPPSDGRRVAIYARKSDLKSESRGKSVSQQVEQCLLAARSLGYEVSERLIFREEDGNKGWYYWQDSEGRNPPPFRVELTRLVQEVEAGNIDIVMCWRTDRIFRDEIVASLFIRKLRSHGVRLFSRSQDYAIHTASGYQRAIAEACENRAYSDKISEDIIRAHATLASVGMLTRDPSCLGFRSAGRGTGGVVAVPEELATVRQVFHWYTIGDGEGPLTARRIAIRLMDSGIRVAVGAKGHKAIDPSRVFPGQITNILRNVQYVGFIKHDETLYPTKLFHVPKADGSGELDTVVSQAMFDEANRLLDEQDWHLRDSNPKLLNGVLICPSCGRKIYGQSRGEGLPRYVYCPYRCGKYRECWATNYRTLHIQELESWVRQHLAPLLAAELMAMKLERRGDPMRVELAAIETRIQALQQAETEKLAELIHLLDAAQIANVAAKFKRDRDELERHAAGLRLRIRSTSVETSNPLDLMAESEGMLRQALLRAVQWMCVTKWGIVVLTKGGAYIGARLARGPKRSRGGHRPPTILPPTVEATLECRSWITDPEAFRAGRRRVEGRFGKNVEDQVLFPPLRVEHGYGTLGCE
jgi:DNA invertase Pin-like site-specific DNA recombinase